MPNSKSPIPSWLSALNSSHSLNTQVNPESKQETEQQSQKATLQAIQDLPIFLVTSNSNLNSQFETQPKPETESQPQHQPTVVISDELEDGPEEQLEDDVPVMLTPSPLVSPDSELIQSNGVSVFEDPKPVPVSASDYYAAVVEQIRQANPTEAALIARLRLYESQYVGIISSPLQAIDHIAQCRAAGVPVGGSEPVEVSPQSTSLAHKRYIERRYAPYKLKKAAVEEARLAWKKAVAGREEAIVQWDEYVKYLHDAYNAVRMRDPSSFVAVEPEPVPLYNPDLAAQVTKTGQDELANLQSFL